MAIISSSKGLDNWLKNQGISIRFASFIKSKYTEKLPWKSFYPNRTHTKAFKDEQQKFIDFVNWFKLNIEQLELDYKEHMKQGNKNLLNRYDNLTEQELTELEYIKNNLSLSNRRLRNDLNISINKLKLYKRIIKIV